MKGSKEKYILLRADVSKEIGYGHFKRVLTIAEYLFDNKSIRSVILIQAAKDFKDFENLKSTEIINIGELHSISSELECIKGFYKRYLPKCLILDVLENDINSSYMNGLKKMNIPIIALTDDSNKREIDASLVLNGNPYQLQYEYIDPERYLLGPKYFVMKFEYGNLEAKKPLNKNFNRLLLTLGGTDHNDLVFKTLDALVKIDEVTEIILISSKFTGYLKLLRDYVHSSQKKINLFFDVDSLAEYFLDVDLAITGGGNSLFERIATRLPGATICQLQRQMEIANKFESLGVNRNIGFGPELNPNEIYTKIREFITDLPQHIQQYNLAKEIVDGKGLFRLMAKLEKLIK